MNSKTNRKTGTILMSVMAIVLALTLLASGTYALFTDTVRIENHLVAGNLNLRLDRLGLKVKEVNEEGFLEVAEFGSFNAENTEYNGKEVVHHFTENDTEDVFMTEGAVPMVPGSSRMVELKLSHEGYEDVGMSKEEYAATYGEDSNVAVYYWFELRLDTEKNADVEWKELAKQLAVHVYTYENGEGWVEKNMTAHSTNDNVADLENARYLYKIEDQVCLFVGDATNPVGTLPLGGSQRFKVKVVFANFGYNYDADTGVLSSKNNAAKNGEVWFDLVVHAVQQTTAPVEEEPTPTPTETLEPISSQVE